MGVGGWKRMKKEHKLGETEKKAKKVRAIDLIRTTGRLGHDVTKPTSFSKLHEFFLFFFFFFRSFSRATIVCLFVFVFFLYEFITWRIRFEKSSTSPRVRYTPTLVGRFDGKFASPVGSVRENQFLTRLVFGKKTRLTQFNRKTRVIVIEIYLSN